MRQKSWKISRISWANSPSPGQKLRRLPLLLATVLTGCVPCPPQLRLSGQRLFVPYFAVPNLAVPNLTVQHNSRCQSAGLKTAAASANLSGVGEAKFLAFGGGGAPHYNEIALEKNMLYFQRSLQTLGQDPASPIFFANGNSGQATLRYINHLGLERYRAPAIPGLRGPATGEVFEQVFDQIQASASQSTPSNNPSIPSNSPSISSNSPSISGNSPIARQPLFIYFSGHGSLNEADANNNAMILWEEDLLDVQTFATRLDALPVEKPVVVMMAQCFSGSFANLMYQGGNPEAPVALHSRCGFFATTQDLPSVGCTPEVNEADYRDYSSSFFAGLTGVDRVGQAVASADYDGSGKISYNEAHSFAKIDEKTSDRPVSTLEIWLQRQLSEQQANRITRQSSLQQVMLGARPERVAVIRALGDRLGFNPQQSFADNVDRLGFADVIQTAEGIGDSDIELQAANLERLRMELLDVVAEQQIRKSGTPTQQQILQRLQTCESQSPGD